ncbi:hypothetical protein Pla110_17650 [Polystyrenella longa]|uniref:Pheromone autoinducer 2 transporter n=1 Tax=Polystyrenella longa TaxID=2528007 RepID=A0A518CLE3_9PLAN|nr:AI-2E family transporter [Polystyrenella longa]QDU80043.1 hypothetical protein Pla110_17650 [Polystyrenella longa]
MNAPTKPIRTNILVPAFFILLMAWLFTIFSAALVTISHFFMLGFLGILLGVFLTKSSVLVGRYTHASYKVCLLLVVVACISIAVLLVTFAGRTIEERIEKATEKLDQSTIQISKWIDSHPSVQSTIEQIPFASEILNRASAIKPFMEGSLSDSLSSSETGSPSEKQETNTNGSENSNEHKSDQENATDTLELLQKSNIGSALGFLVNIFQAALAAILNFAIVIVVGLFLAVDPELYRDGIVKLIKPDLRERARDILNQSGSQLWAWLMGRLLTMLITGFGTGFSLYLIGAPIPLMLGLITGILTFVPNIGAAIALTVAVLISIPEGLTIAGLVIVTFVAFQILESYVFTPLIQQQAVAIPPALLITWQVLLGMIAGFLGVAIATPLLAVILVMIRTLYLEDVLGEEKQSSTSTA